VLISSSDPRSTDRSPSCVRPRRDALRLIRLCCAIFITALPLLGFSAPANQARTEQMREGKNAGQLYDFKIAKPDFVVDGANLSKVEIWSWPTGTGITEPALIGTATRITDSGRHERWILRIPRDLLSVEIFATASDERGKVIGKKSLPYKGASALYEALYGKK
jgi:hypothetical protein